MRRGGLLQGDYKGRLPAFEKNLLALLYEITSKKESKFFFLHQVCEYRVHSLERIRCLGIKIDPSSLSLKPPKNKGQL